MSSWNDNGKNFEQISKDYANELTNQVYNDSGFL